jgi:mono/diheme cytochrome c family protein
MIVRCFFVVNAALAVITVFLPAAPAAEPLTFEKHVRPILKVHCFQCHGEEEKHEANLDLRLVRQMTKGGDSGPAIVAGKASESLLVERLAVGEMPPEGKGKPIAAKDLATIRTWLDQGAKTARPEPEALAAVTDDEQDFWSFQPLGKPSLPNVATDQLRSPIDAFLLAELEKHNFSFSLAADKPTLIRRASFDLAGLPPSPEEVDAFVADASPDAWERLLDRLLASPRYGERWGRHWLDVAGYADSDGYTEKDPERKYAYKYRDYVIRSLNSNKPWDEFLREQLAGDELLTPPYTNLSPEQADLLAATGFLRMAPDGTADGGVDQTAARNDVMAETLKIVSSSLLGLTVGCAQCHDHRYDPIPQADYYRFRAIFEPAYDVKNWRAPSARLISLWSNETRETAAAIDADLKKLADERQAEMDKIVAAIFDSEVEKLPEEERELATAAKGAAAKDRTDEQKQLLKDHPSLNVSRGSAYLYDKKRVDSLNKDFDARQKELQAHRPAEDFVPCLTETPGKIPQTFVFYRGDVNQPRQEVRPGELSVLGPRNATEGADPRDCVAGPYRIPADDPGIPTTGRRLTYARWLTSGEQPLAPRVLVNRVWMLHFGRGIVATPGDFGQLGARPSHPELLDWLARRFMQDGWELKRFHRLLMTSAAYRQASRRTDALDAIDPENRLLGRLSIRRLEAEAVRDSILAASGNMNLKMLGAPVPVTVDEVGQVIVGLDNRDSAGRPQGKRGALGADEYRRSVYVQVRRSLPLSMLESFDAPALNPNCEIRNRSTVAPQSLLLMNSDFVLAQSQALAERVVGRCGADRPTQVRLAWRLALGQEPSPGDLEAATALLEVQEADFAAPKSPDKAPLPPPATRALASLCQALFSSNGFLYID